MITEEPVFKKQNIMQQSGKKKSSSEICMLAAEKNTQIRVRE